MESNTWMLDALKQSVGDLIGAAVALSALFYQFVQQRRIDRARSSDFHVYVREVRDPTPSDEPINQPGYWVVFSNGTGVPVTKWRVDLELKLPDGSVKVLPARETRIEASKYGPIPPTQSRLVAFRFNAETPPESLHVRQWSFRAGTTCWTRDCAGKRMAIKQSDVDG
jgi:hypothetical protein